jgi:predicted DNA-binding transcriptional regulator
MNEISMEIGISESSLYRYLNFLKSKDLVCDHATNLKLKSIRDFGSHRKKVSLLIEADHSLFDITCLLYCKLIEKKVRQMALVESVRRSGRGDKFKVISCEIPFRPFLSIRTIAKLLNISEYKAFIVEKNLVRLGVIRREKQKPEYLSECFTDLKSIEDMPGYRFTVEGKLFEIFAARIDLLQFPVFLRRFSYKALKQIFRTMMTLKLLYF